MYTLRVDLLEVSIDTVVGWLHHFSKSFIYVQEGSASDNPHVHAVFYTDATPHTMRTNLRAKGLRGNKSYSLTKAKDLVKSVAYCMKLNDPFVHEFPQDILNQAKEYDQKVKSEIKSKTKLNLTQYYIQEVKNKQLKDLNSIIKMVLDDHIARGVMVRPFNIEGYAITALLHNSPYAQMQFTSNLARKINLQFEMDSVGITLPPGDENPLS